MGDPRTLAARSALGLAQFLDGHPVESAALLEKVVADAERLAGPDHEQTRLARDRLAKVWLSSGRVAEAVALYERNYADHARVLGEEHQETLIAQNNLAGALLDAGQSARAIDMYTRNAAARERLAERYPHVEFRLAEPLGPHPLLTEIVVQRAKDVTRDE